MNNYYIAVSILLFGLCVFFTSTIILIIKNDKLQKIIKGLRKLL